MRLGIVGHAAEKFTPETQAAAEEAIAQLIAWYDPEVVVSGHSPMGGVDILAEEMAKQEGIKLDIKTPRQHTWDGEYGFKARNLDIAKSSDLVVCIVVKELPRGFKGMKFGDCYHCKGRNPPHVKSGGCWTAWKALRRKWVIL